MVACSAYSQLKMEAVSSCESSVDFQRTTRRYIPEDSTYHNHCWEPTNPTFRCYYLCYHHLFGLCNLIYNTVSTSDVRPCQMQWHEYPGMGLNGSHLTMLGSIRPFLPSRSQILPNYISVLYLTGFKHQCAMHLTSHNVISPYSQLRITLGWWDTLVYWRHGPYFRAYKN
jgi:hypothetical protein